MDASLPPGLPPLLPMPEHVSARRGSTLLHRDCRTAIQCDDVRVAAEWRRMCSTLPCGGSDRRAGVSSVWIADTAGGEKLNEPTAGCRAALHPQGYRLHIEPDRIELFGGSAAGCFYGLQTLRQLFSPLRTNGGEWFGLPAMNGRALADSPAADRGARTSPCTGELPLCTIEDRPDFEARGLLHDITRGKCPTLATLKLLADRLAAMKINQLQLYIEHAFDFSFDPAICGREEGLTPDEVRELDAHCRERFIELVPAVATLGHMGRILSMPNYAHLAEVPAAGPWAEMTWRERLRGLTLDVLNPESRELVSRMWSDIFDAFSGPVVNICGDEPWDLGRGRNASRLDERTRGEAYVDHIRWTCDLCSARGRQAQLWGDVAGNYPGLLSRLPPELTVLHWGYGDEADYAGTRVFTEAGLRTLVCPGTSGWKRILNAMDVAERNITTFARVGREHGATGLINTDWGDYGHFNALACSWHGIALGAAVAWNADESGGPQFDRRFGATFLGPDGGVDSAASASEGVGLLRRASAIAEHLDTWPALYSAARGLPADPNRPTAELLEDTLDAAKRARRALARVTSDAKAVQDDLRELSLACECTELLAVRLRTDARARAEPAAVAPREWHERLAAAAEAYGDAWRRRNKPLRLDNITDRLAPAGGRTVPPTSTVR